MPGNQFEHVTHRWAAHSRFTFAMNVPRQVFGATRTSVAENRGRALGEARAAIVAALAHKDDEPLRWSGEPSDDDLGAMLARVDAELEALGKPVPVVDVPVF
jgi:predicted trehalose synthase